MQRHRIDNILRFRVNSIGFLLDINVDGNERRKIQPEPNGIPRNRNYFSLHSLNTYDMNNVIFWDIPPCSLHVNGRFGGTYHFHLQGRKSAEHETSASHWVYTSHFVPNVRRICRVLQHSTCDCKLYGRYNELVTKLNPADSFQGKHQILWRFDQQNWNCNMRV
jgi:hypothetical protein